MTPAGAPQAYGTIVVCGGGCYGGYYVRQLARARAAGALRFEQVLVVDRNPEAPVAQLAAAIAAEDGAAAARLGWRMQRATGEVLPPGDVSEYAGLPITFVAAGWQEFFDGWLGAAIDAPGRATRDAVVPSPLMPHLLADWVASRLRLRRPGAAVDRVPLTAVPDTPWQRSANDLAHYASFATWMCPINCIEPARCPEIRGTRDWTMPAAVRRAADRAAEAGTPYDVVAQFHTTHRAFGVGMFDANAAIEADTSIQHAAAAATLRVLVASVSHCHGALAELVSTRVARPGTR